MEVPQKRTGPLDKAPFFYLLQKRNLKENAPVYGGTLFVTYPFLEQIQTSSWKWYGYSILEGLLDHGHFLKWSLCKLILGLSI